MAPDQRNLAEFNMSPSTPQPTTSFTASKGGIGRTNDKFGRAGADSRGKGGPTKRRARRQSEYGAQLSEKQTTKRLYGLRERQFRRYFMLASKTPAATGETLLQLLETRLDNIVYRLGYGRTRPAARQLVTHGHVQVNGKRVSIPSQAVSVSDTVLVRLKNIELGEGEVPGWLEKSKTQTGGTLLNLPSRAEIQLDVNEQLIVEFYSR